MDGIFGVGLAEMLIVGLALFIIGGPKNTAKWARDLGRMVRKVRETWSEIMAEMENELGPEGKEFMEVTRELSKGANDLRKFGSPQRRLLDQTMRVVDEATDIESVEKTPTSSSSNGNSAAQDSRYRAWLPPDSNT
jgi:Sec-independent protein translocase protein TatA